DKKKKFQTKVQRKSLNPVFNESFQFKVPYNEINSQTLVMNVFDFDRFGKHDQIGQVSVPLGKVDLATTIEKTVAIEASPENRLGEVCLALRYVPNKNKLTVVVMEYYNESFSYEVSPEKLQRVHLHIIVSDYDRVGSNERIGHVIIGNNASGVGLKHWHDMIATPRRSVAAWHALQPDAD
uniref:C2 domain-containing protein n=1 Tax=Meloidogyne javanica TaxID=6303 RepID=A0A915MEV0_MELJA